MQYTENYHLPQWVKSDRIMMDDFNQMCQDIEAGLTSSAAKADAAQAAAEALPYVVGSYTGDGSTYRNIDVGFQPSFVIVCADQRISGTTNGGLSVMMAGRQCSSRLYMTATGFRLDSSDTVNPYPQVNSSGRVYDYIAFK